MIINLKQKYIHFLFLRLVLPTQWIMFVISLIFVYSCNTSSNIIYNKENDDGYIFIKDSTDRSKNPETFFQEEYLQINERRKPKSNENKPPQNLTGLAFSGGGIRSNAFHLGYLSALNNKTIKYVDYISSVSGGSWAAGAYKVMENPQKEFDDLDKFAERKNDDTGNAYLLSNYGKTLSLVSNALGKAILNKMTPVSTGEGYFAREEWRNMIQNHFLKGKDIKLSDLEKDYRIQRPYLILNGSHTAFRFLSKASTFEFTGHKIGTHQNSENKDGGFFLNLKNNEARGSFYLSHALAVSSAIPPDFSWYITLFGRKFTFFDAPGLEWYFYSRNDSKKYINLQSEYAMTDGGHLENLGVLGLMERGVKLIIITDAGEDSKYNFADLKKLIKLSPQIIGKQIFFEDAKDESNKNKDKYYLYYGSSKDKREGKIIFLKPRFDINSKDEFLKCNGKMNDFKSFLLCFENGRFQHIYNYLNFNSVSSFPQNSTFATSYSNNLLKAYYLIGKYYGQLISNEIDEFHEKNKE